MTNAPNAPSPRRVLGVDLGLKRTGLAISDALGISTRPLENLIPKSRAEDVAVLVGLCRDLEVEAVVIGLPLMPQSGDENPMTRRARGFAAALEAGMAKADLAVPVHLLDERYSSRDAARRMAQAAVPKMKRRKRLDGEAAALLIESFLREQPLGPADKA